MISNIISAFIGYLLADIFISIFELIVIKWFKGRMKRDG